MPKLFDKKITLENGCQISKDKAHKKLAILRELLKDDPLDLSELIEKCRDPEYQLHDQTISHLRALNLMTANYIKGSIRNLVLSVIKGEARDMYTTTGDSVRASLAPEHDPFHKPKI